MAYIFLETAVASKMSSQVVGFYSQRSSQKPIKLGFEWSLRPLIIINRFIGIHLDFPFCSLSSKDVFHQISWWLITILGFLLFFLNVESNFLYVSDYISYAIISKNHTKTSMTQTWNEVAVFFNGALTLVGIHAIFIAFSWINWPHLAKLLLVMEQRSLFNQKNYQRFRHICFGWAIVFITVSSEFWFVWKLHLLLYILWILNDRKL